VIVQIYEIQAPQEAEECLAAGVNQIGSVLLSESAWRDPGVKRVGELVRAAGARHSVIPLFGGELQLCRMIEYYEPAYVHFCENLSDGARPSASLQSLVGLQERLKERFPALGIIRAIPIPPPELGLTDFPWRPIAAAFEPVSDLFLIDTWLPAADSPVPEFVGITGRRADPTQCRALVEASALPVILAGGLSPENVRDAVLQIRPAGADSCTQTNRLDASGRPIRFAKDIERVRAFVREVARAQRDLAAQRAPQPSATGS
jgi:phosphoribosylanthranilate isomerase